MKQIHIPMEVAETEVLRERSLGGAIELCVKAAGLEPKQVQLDCKFDKGQYARWMTGAEGVVWPRLVALMDRCGNDAPLQWMVHDRGFDMGSLRHRETETERRLRMAQEENAALRRVLMGKSA